MPASPKRTRADTLAARTARVMFALIAYFDLDARQLDGVNAFLNSPLDEDERIYCHFPPGFKRNGLVMKLQQALHGLPRSPYLWFKELSQSLSSLGFTPVFEDPCILTNGRIIVFFYVDDIVVASRKEDRPKSNELVRKLQSLYEIRDLGELQWFLNIRVTRDRPNRRLYLTQDAYVDKIVKLYGLAGGPTIQTPLSRDSASAYKPYNGQATADDIKAYQQRVGSVIYPAYMTRPDIAMAVSILARFMQNPSPFHMDEVNRVICYLRDTKDLSICYDGSLSYKPPNEPVSTSSLSPLFALVKSVFEASSDAAYGDDPVTRQSTERYLFKLFGGLIDWKATRQTTVTTSTTEAELLSLSNAAKQLAWWQRLFSQLGFDPGHDPKLHCDNLMSTGILTKQAPAISTKLRHIDIHQHWLRERVQKGKLSISWIPTSSMPTDGLTKPLPRQKHETFVKLLGLVRCPAR